MTQKEFQEKLTEFYSQCTITSNGRLYKVPESLKTSFIAFWTKDYGISNVILHA